MSAGDVCIGVKELCFVKIPMRDQRELVGYELAIQGRKEERKEGEGYEQRLSC